jgi:hypothetical protein
VSDNNQLLEEIREKARRNAAARGMTLKEQIDELERLSGAVDYFSALRVLYCCQGGENNE